MICPKCKELGLRSRVYPGMSMVTAMFFRPFYDEDGELHNHDNNIRTTEYSCSNRHRWVEYSYGKCWCGWNGGEARIEMLDDIEPIEEVEISKGKEG